MSTPITSKDTPKMTSSPAANMPLQAQGTLPSTDQTALLQSDVGGPTLSTPAHTGMGQTHIPIDITAPSGAESVAAVRKDHPRKIPSSVPPSQAPPELTYADSLYTTAVIFSAFASAVSFGAILYYAIRDIGPVFNTYLAFAYLFLIFTYFQTLSMIYGFAKAPDQRKMVNQSSMGLAWFNIILGIIAVVTFATRQDDYPVNNTPYACLIIGIILEFIAFMFQLAGHRHIASLPRDNSNYYFPPLKFQTSTITGLLVLNPLLCVITFSFALGAVVNANGLAEIASQQTQAAAAFASLFFITGTIGAIIAVLTIVPGPSVEPLVATSWVFSLMNFIFSFLAFILLFAQGVSNRVAAFWFLAWIISLLSFAVSLAGWLLMGGRTGEYCCRCDDLGSEITRQRNIVELEKARLEAAIVRKERETLELAQT